MAQKFLEHFLHVGVEFDLNIEKIKFVMTGETK